MLPDLRDIIKRLQHSRSQLDIDGEWWLLQRLSSFSTLCIEHHISAWLGEWPKDLHMHAVLIALLHPASLRNKPSVLRILCYLSNGQGCESYVS
jgi:hypothetical protein